MDYQVLYIHYIIVVKYIYEEFRWKATLAFLARISSLLSLTFSRDGLDFR